MAIVWKINGSTPESLGLSNLRLSFVNQQADELTFDDATADFDGAAQFAINAEIVLTRTVDANPAVTVFRGYVRQIPRRGNGRLENQTFIARGGWDQLERYAYLQTFVYANDPSDPESTTTTATRGRLVIGQSDAGAKVSIGTFVDAVVDYAIAAGADLAVGTIDLGVTVPWDEATDLSCAEVISRVLQWAPDAVVWFDYSVDPPTFNCQRRADLSTQSYALHTKAAADSPSFAPIDEIVLNPRHDLVVPSVYLIYIATNRENQVTWETRTVDSAGTGGATVPNALVRTIQLAGSVLDSNYLTQQVVAETIPAGLVHGGAVVSGDGDFATISAWWKAHVPWLKQSNVTILGFRVGTKAAADDTSLDETCVNELIDGAITDWMEDAQGVNAQLQRLSVQVAADVTDPVTAKKERVIEQLEVTIMATSATTRTYSFLAEESYTEPEPVPSGLATALYNALSVLHWDGQISLIEEEPSLPPVGKVVNLTNGLTAWETMKALIQRITLDLDAGRTTLTVGPPKQLGPDDLVEIYRVNRNRVPVTSYLVRTTGKTGVNTSAQGLALYQPVKPGAASLPVRPRVYTAEITMADVVPTPAEIVTAIESVYSSTNEPVAGDIINLQVTISSVLKTKFRAFLTSTNPGDTGTLWAHELTINSRTYYAQVIQTGLY